MERVDWSITTEYSGWSNEQFLFTYSEEEREEARLNKMNAELVLKPKFIPLYPKLLQNGYGLMESVLFGFIDFFLSNNNRFYCTNEQLAELFNCSPQTISTAIKSLEDRWNIVLHKKRKAWGGTIRFITLGNQKNNITENQKIVFWQIKNVDGIENKIIENKNIDNIIINNNTEQSSEHNQIGLLDSSMLVDKEKEKNSAKKEKEITTEINDLISRIKEVCNELWVAYNKEMERQFAKHILTAKEYGNFCEKIWQSRVEFALNVLRVSVMIGYFRGALSWPKLIYKNYAELYNQAKQKAQKISTPTINVL